MHVRSHQPTLKPRALSGMTRAQWVEHMARLDEARRKGSCAKAEGTPLHLCPYKDADYSRAWMESWMHAWMSGPAA